MFVYRNEDAIAPIRSTDCVEKPLLSLEEQMTKNRRTIAELLQLNMPDLEVRNMMNVSTLYYYRILIYL